MNLKINQNNLRVKMPYTSKLIISRIGLKTVAITNPNAKVFESAKMSLLIDNKDTINTYQPEYTYSLEDSVDPLGSHVFVVKLDNSISKLTSRLNYTFKLSEYTAVCSETLICSEETYCSDPEETEELAKSL